MVLFRKTLEPIRRSTDIRGSGDIACSIGPRNTRDFATSSGLADPLGIGICAAKRSGQFLDALAGTLAGFAAPEFARAIQSG